MNLMLRHYVRGVLNETMTGTHSRLRQNGPHVRNALSPDSSSYEEIEQISKVDQDLQDDDLAQHLQGKSAVIIKGNPKYTGLDIAKAFYSDLEDFLVDQGFTVHVDDGSTESVPPEADVWIGHSRGIDKLTDAPDGTMVIKMGLPGEEDTINHPKDDAKPGEQPNKYHFVLTPEMKEQLKTKIGQSGNDPTVDEFGPVPPDSEPVSMHLDPFVRGHDPAIRIG